MMSFASLLYVIMFNVSGFRMINYAGVESDRLRKTISLFTQCYLSFLVNMDFFSLEVELM